MKISLKAFVTLGTTLLSALVALVVIFIYTDIIQKEVYLSTEREIQGLFERDKDTIIKMIQLGTYLDLNQHLKSYYGKKPLVRKISVSTDGDVVATFEAFDKKNSHERTYHFPLLEHGQTWGIANVVIDQKGVEEKVEHKLKGLYTTGLIILLVTIFLAYLFSALLAREVHKIIALIGRRHDEIQKSADLKELQTRLENFVPSKSFLLEISSLSYIFDNFLGHVKEANTRLNKLENEVRLGQQAQQIAHDIRSPLEVLKGLRQDLQKLPEDSKRRIQMSIQRIEEIATNLLKTHKKNLPTADTSNPEELLGLLKSVINEKKIEFSSREGVEIVDRFTPEACGAISKVRRGNLKRVLSNLINNAVDALEGNPGTISLNLKKEDAWNIIEVSDTGVGIPESIKNNLFKRGFTSKEKGHGLGLSGAMEEIASLGGKIDFSTKLGEGTTFKIFIPRSQDSDVRTSLDIFKYEKIIILDDDISFHEFWHQKLEGTKQEIESFTSVKDIHRKYKNLPPRSLLLSDFELMDEQFDGIDVIAKYEAQKISFLVTARDDDPSIIKRCHHEGIQILSKSIIHHLGINLKAPMVVLIDDDKLIRLDWKNYFDRKNVPVQCFSSIDEFLSASSAIGKEAFIYVDSHLGNSSLGEIESERIYRQGFHNLYLATGYQKENFQKPHWIRDIHGKNPRSISYWNF